MPTTTPLVWLDTFIANLETNDTQRDPQIVGLSNGNFLVAWTDFNDTVAPSTGSDLVGVIFDPLGKPLTDSLFLNGNSGRLSNESQPDITATDDGGFAMAFYYPLDGDDLVFTRYDSEGVQTQNTFLVNDGGATTVTYSDPELVARPDGTFLAVYEKSDGATQEIAFKTISATGVVGSETILRTDGGSADGDPRDPALAVLSDGRVVVAFAEEDGDGVYGIETRVINADNSLGSIPNVNTANNSIDPDIAALEDDGWVVTWSDDGDIYAWIYNADASEQSSQLNIAVGADNKNETQVIGLPDGGFFVVWDNDTDDRMEGRRFDADGNAVGGQINLNGAIPTQPDIGLTSDGRILVSWSGTGEVNAIILDPRDDGLIVVTDGTPTTATPFGSAIDGSDANDVFYGQDGADDFSSKKGADLLYGGLGNDELAGGKGADKIWGGKGNDVIEGAIGADEMWGGKGKDKIWGLDGRDVANGNDGADTLYGGGKDDELFGGDGGDGLFGGSGDDSLFGGNGRDELTGGQGVDEMTGGGGDDVFIFASASQSGPGAANRDIITDFVGGSDIIDLSAIDADTTRGGNQAFEFISTDQFDDEGQLRVAYKNGNTFIRGDLDGDGDKDFEIKLDGQIGLTDSDFIL